MKIIEKTSFPYKCYDELDSTNTTLLKSELKGVPWYTIRAINQRAGRGRTKKEWIAQAGKDLTFSTAIPIEAQLFPYLPNMTQLAGMAVHKVLESYGIAAEIKWPNDLLVNGRKICGILVEGAYQKGVQHLIAGIGLNVNSGQSTIAGVRTTSLCAEIGQEVALTPLLNALIFQLQREVHLLKAEGLPQLIKQLNTHLAFRGMEREVRDGEASVRGRIEGLSPSGMLLLSTAQGVRECLSGEIRF